MELYLSFRLSFLSAPPLPALGSIITKQHLDHDFTSIDTDTRARTCKLKKHKQDFPGGTVVRNPPVNAGDTGSSPGPGGSHMPRSS